MLYNIQMIDMPTSTRATHTLNDDGSYTIFVNSKLNIEQQHLGCMHEIEHIKHEDIQRDESADIIESITHRKVKYGYTKKEW